MRGLVSMFALRSQGQLAAAYRFFSSQRSVFALTADYEPFGLAPLEAMAAGSRRSSPRTAARASPCAKGTKSTGYW